MGRCNSGSSNHDTTQFDFIHIRYRSNKITPREWRVAFEYQLPPPHPLTRLMRGQTDKTRRVDRGCGVLAHAHAASAYKAPAVVGGVCRG